MSTNQSESQEILQPTRYESSSRTSSSLASAQFSDQRFRALIEHSSDVILLSDREGKYSYASPSIQRILGYTPEEFVQLNGFTIIHPDDLPSITQAFQTLLATPGLTETRQFRVRHNNGSWHWVEATATNLLQEPTIQAIVTNFHDITKHKQAAETLLHLAAIVESSDEAILGKDLEGNITSWNTAAERIYGYTAQEIVGQPVTLLFAPDRQDEFTQIMARIQRGERVDHYETIRMRKDGTSLNVSVTISPIKDSTGTIIGASAIARDITEHRQLEAELLAGTIQRDALTPPEFHFLSQNAVKAMQEAGSSGTYEKEYWHKSGKRIPVLVAVAGIEQTETCIGFVLDISERKELDKRKDEFISMASHELKTPLTSLKGFFSLLERRLTTQGNQQELHYLTRINAQVNKLTKLINDLLDLSKMQTGQLAYREERFEMDALVQEIMENVQGTTQTHHLQLEGQTQAEVFGDWDRIGQVLTNLLNNAIKYSPQADTVLIRTAKDQNKILVSIQDFGIGIAKEHQEKIFERFYQVTDPDEKTYPGLGIGLYISYEIVKRHGGQMWVESKKGQGATFHFTLALSAQYDIAD